MGTAWSSVWQCRALGWWDGGSRNGGSQLEAATSFSLPHLAGGERALPCLCTRSGSAPVALSLLPVPAVSGPRETSSSTSFAEFWQLQHVLHDKSLFLALFSSLPLPGATVSFPPAISSSASPSSWTTRLLASLLPGHEATPCPAGDRVPAVARDQACVSPPAERCREGSGGLTCCFSPPPGQPQVRAAPQPPSPCTHLLQNGAGRGPDPGGANGEAGNGVFRPLPSTQKPHRKLQSHHSINSQSSKKSKGSSKSASSHIPIEAQEGTSSPRGGGPFPTTLLQPRIPWGVSWVASFQPTGTPRPG